MEGTDCGKTRAGLAARGKGRIGGRRPKLTTELWAQLGQELPRQQVAIIYDVGLSTLYQKVPGE